MDLFSKILSIYLLFNILKKFGGHSPLLLVHGSIPEKEQIKDNTERVIKEEIKTLQWKTWKISSLNLHWYE